MGRDDQDDTLNPGVQIDVETRAEDGLPVAVTLRAHSGLHMTPELLAVATTRAAAQLRVLLSERESAAWHATTGQHVRAELRSVWQGRVTDVYLATLAWAYVEVRKCDFVHIIPTLAGMLERSPNTIKMHVVRARDRGFLTGETGKTSGKLTARARRILDQHLADAHPHG